jgi:VWFA-related protein
LIRRASAVALLFILAGAAAAQERMTIDVSIVNVDVVVTDRQNRPVTGLTAKDFEIRENNNPQPITNFTEYRTPLAKGSGLQFSVCRPEPVDGTTPTPLQTENCRPDPAAAIAKPEKRTIVLFIERFLLPAFRTKPLFESMRTMLEQTVRPGDAVAIYSWSDWQTFLRTPFTDDVDELRETLSEIEDESTGVRDDTVDMPRTMTYRHVFHDGTVAELDTSAFEGAASGSLELARIRRKADAVKSLMQAISGVEGRKILLMATNRFGVYAGADKFFGGEVPIDRRVELSTDRIRQSLVQTANAYGVTIYPLYPSGIGTSYIAINASDSPSDIHSVDRIRDHQAAARDQNVLTNETASLQEIAQGTGGLLAWGHKDVMSLLPRITADLDSYYSLAYRATAVPGSRKITVKVKNARYTVRTRSRVVERTDTEKMQDRVITNLHHTLTSSVIPIEATVGDRTEVGIPITIRIPVAALTTRPGGGGQFTVFIATGGELGIINDVQHRTDLFTTAARNAMPSHLTYDFTLATDTLTDRVSIGVMDEVSNEYGLVRIDLR